MELDFHKALKKIVREELKGNNPVPDILGFLHLKTLFGSDFIKKLESLLEAYEKKDCTPSPLLKIDVPKSNFTVRPMARPDTKDWLIYEALVDYLSQKILKDEKICERSFSILNFKPPYAKKTRTWLKFDERCRDLYYKEEYKYAVTTDITGYFENINLEELRKRIVNYLEEGDEGGKKLTNVLFNCFLRRWSKERIEGYGLPQGPPGSSFLADIFLDYVDRRMEKYQGYFRYMDDIRIFCKKEIDAKRALKELTLSLRELKLNINAKKTAILHHEKIEEKLLDPKKTLLNTIEEVIKSKNKALIKIIISPLIKVVEEAFAGDPFAETHLNFAIYRLSILHNSGFDYDEREIIKKIMDNFVAKPHHTGLFCDFLSLFPNDKDIPNSLISFLKSENNIYEWQELKVLQVLLRFNLKASKSEIEFFMSSAQDSNKHYAVRAFYFLLAGKHGTNRDRELIVDSYDSLSKIYTKMAVILSVRGLGVPARNAFYSRIKRSESNNEIKQFIDYVKSLLRPIYFLTTERPKIETYEKFKKSFYEST